jgi:hypothetical protein
MCVRRCNNAGGRPIVVCIDALSQALCALEIMRKRAFDRQLADVNANSDGVRRAVRIGSIGFVAALHRKQNTPIIYTSQQPACRELCSDTVSTQAEQKPHRELNADEGLFGDCFSHASWLHMTQFSRTAGYK